MSNDDMDALGMELVNPYDRPGPSTVPEKPKRSEAKGRRRRKRRMQLAAALVEADNDEIQRRIDFLTNVDPSSKHLLTDESLMPKYANQSVMFHDALEVPPWQPYSRPVYVHTPQSMRGLTQSYLGMGGHLVGDDPSELHILDESMATREPTSVDDVAQMLLDVSLPREELGPTMESTWSNFEDKVTKRPKMRSTSSLPTLTDVKEVDDTQDESSVPEQEKKPEDFTRSALLLARIRKSRIVSDSKTMDADISAELDDSQDKGADAQEPQENSAAEPAPGSEQAASIASYNQEPVELTEPVSGTTSDLQGFRARVLKRRSEPRRSSRRHSLAVSGWPEESNTLEVEPSEAHTDPDMFGAMYAHQLAHATEGLDGSTGLPISDARKDSMRVIAPLLARRASVRQDDLTSSKWTKRKQGLRALFPFERRKPPRERSKQEEPMIQLDTPGEGQPTSKSQSILSEPSPVADQSNTEKFATPQPYADDDLIGVSLQTPVVDQAPSDVIPSLPPDPSQIPPEQPQPEPDLGASFEPNPVALPTRAKRTTFICIPAPLEHMPREYPQTSFYAPHGAFYVDDRGVVLPRNKTQNEAHYELDFGPVEVPAGIGRRVLYPTTALFRNVLAFREEDHEGWGFERFTNALSYFSALHADDDDSDDEVPLMDVRIQTKEEQLARRRIHRERVRRKRAHMERRRLRDLAKRQGKRASVFGIPEESSESPSDVSTEYSSLSSDETDPEQPWRDDRRPAGRLFGSNLLEMASEHQKHKQSQVRFYGQVNLENPRHSAPPETLGGFHDDTRQRMAKVFGPQPRWMNDIIRREEQNAREQYKSLSVGGTPLLGDQEKTDLLMEPGVQEGIIYPSVLDATEAEARAAEEADDAAVAAWQDSSSDDEPEMKHTPVRFQPEKPRWETHEEDDLPLNRLRRHPRTGKWEPIADDSDDEQPLGNRHRQAAIIAENQALIRQLLEENRQVRMSLQMLTSGPYGMPWMPQMPGHFQPMPQFDEDAPLLDDAVQDVGLAAPSETHSWPGYRTAPARYSAPEFDPVRSSMYSGMAMPLPLDPHAGLGVMQAPEKSEQAANPELYVNEPPGAVDGEPWAYDAHNQPWTEGAAAYGDDAEAPGYNAQDPAFWITEQAYPHEAAPLYDQGYGGPMQGYNEGEPHAPDGGTMYAAEPVDYAATYGAGAYDAGAEDPHAGYVEQGAYPDAGPDAPPAWDTNAVHREVFEWLAAPEAPAGAPDLKGSRFEEVGEEHPGAQPPEGDGAADLLDMYSHEHT